MLSVLIMASVVGVSFLSQHAEASPGDEVTLRLKWLHQAQFAGFYTAEQKGFYENNGIDITINPGGIDFPAVQMVASGGEQFGVTGGDQIILARDKGVPIVAIAVIYRESPFVLFALEESGITEPNDFVGKNVGVKLGGNEELTYRAMMMGAGVDTSLVNEKPVKFDISPLLSGQIDVWPGYAINEPVTAEEKGFPVNIIWPSDYGVNLYADTIFTTEDMINNNPDLVKRFLSATMQGWNYAYDNVDESVDYTLMYADVLTKEHETSMMEASLKSLKPGDQPIGPMDKEVWEGMQTLLLDNGFTENAIDLDEAFTNEFLPQAGVDKVALVTDALFSDQGWGTNAYTAATNLSEKYGFELGTAESVAIPDIESTLRDFAEQDYDLIIAHGFQWTDPALIVSPDYPDTKIFVFTGYASGPGVASISPLQQEGTFPLGALAGMLTETNVVGFVGGQPYPNLINIFEGFKAGAMYTNPDVEVLVSWTDDWDDPAKGNAAAEAQIAQGADILFHTADTAGQGMIRAAQDHGIYAFGAVLDQNVTLDWASDTILTSFVLDIEKSFDMAYTITNEGNFEGVMIEPGIETGPGGPGDGIVYLAPFHEHEGAVPQDVKNNLDAIVSDIQNGHLVIPFTAEFTAAGESALTVDESVAATEVASEGGGGCLIATAAFGSEMAPQVQFLREIRDNTVLQTESGTNFMTGFNQFYYSFSPVIADYERENPAFKETVKLALTPLLTSLTLLQYADIDSESEMLGYGIGVILLNIGMYFVAPAVLIMTVGKKILKK